MRRLAIFSIGALCGAASFGQDLLECVDPDVLKALVFPGVEQRTAVSAAVPDEMSDVDVPGEFGWIGSLERNLGSFLGTAETRTTVSAAYRTSLAPAAAHDAAVASLEAGGWEVQPAQAPLGGGVFVARDAAMSATACRGDEAVTVTTNALDGATYVLYGFSRGDDGSVCDSRLRGLALAGMRPLGEMPTLVLPLDRTSGAPARILGGGGSNQYARAEFRLDESLGNVASALSLQMTDQGWIGDASWSGTTTAGSSWSKQTDEGMFHATLHVTELDDSTFSAVLRVVRSEGAL